MAYQCAIEKVYWRHRIWPKENAQPKPPLDAMISQAQLEKKVEGYLGKSQLVTDQRGWPITPTELADLLGMPPTTLSSYVRRLEARRQVKRRPNPDDGRSSLLELTKLGDRFVVAGFPALRGSIARVEEHLDYPAEDLDLALDRLEDAMRRALSRPDESMRRPARRAPRRAR